MDTIIIILAVLAIQIPLFLYTIKKIDDAKDNLENQIDNLRTDINKRFYELGIDTNVTKEKVNSNNKRLDDTNQRVTRLENIVSPNQTEYQTS